MGEIGDVVGDEDEALRVGIAFDPWMEVWAFDPWTAASSKVVSRRSSFRATACILACSLV